VKGRLFDREAVETQGAAARPDNHGLNLSPRKAARAYLQDQAVRAFA
jgi:hypothetical protein